MNLLNMQLFRSLYYFIPLRYKYSLYVPLSGYISPLM
jgi:hypothetical protein